MISVLTIGGSDSSGGAGIQADLKIFSLLGLHGSSVVTCVTAQSTGGVESIYRLPLEIISKQIDTVVKDLRPKFVKTGMLYSQDIVKLVAEKIRKYKLKAVVDPVMVSTTNVSLAEKNFTNSLRVLIPEAELILPNLYEAGELTGWKVKDIKSMERACKALHKLGATYVLLKGGHLKRQAVDILYDGKNFKRYSSPKLRAKAHGSGCSYSALITGFLAKGLRIEDAVAASKKLITKIILAGYKPGKGVDVVNQYAIVKAEAEKYRVLKELRAGVKWIEKNLKPKFVPEVGINFVYALPNALSLEDVCGIEGRLIKVGNNLKRAGELDFGKSKHVATVALTAMHQNPEFRSAINLKYSEELLERAKRKLKISSFGRKREPAKVSTMEWGTKSAIKKLGFVPDLIYDKGAVGKEAMIRVLGRSPGDVIRKLRLII